MLKLGSRVSRGVGWAVIGLAWLACAAAAAIVFVVLVLGSVPGAVFHATYPWAGEADVLDECHALVVARQALSQHDASAMWTAYVDERAMVRSLVLNAANHGRIQFQSDRRVRVSVALEVHGDRVECWVHIDR